MEKLQSWLTIEENSDFSIYNLPFGIYSVNGSDPQAGMAIGDQIINLATLAQLELINVAPDVLKRSTLNDFIRLGKSITSKVRLDVQQLLCDPNSPLKEHPNILILQSDAQMHLPVQVGDYTDFYSSIEHATNVGMMFRDPANALLPNWRHLPVGYHGRSSSIIVSGQDVVRPKGQVMPKDADQPIYRPSARLDFELETGYIIGKDSEIGKSVSTSEAKEYIFGKVLFNDWSARDIQKWEYVPLGPFLGKSFASSISPWIVTLEALEPFKVAGPRQEPAVLDYLQYEGDSNYDIALEVGIKPENGEEQIVCRSNFKYMYWNMAQQLAHHTINGCNVRVGDMMGSGTISGKDENSYGSMLELSWGGKKTIPMKDGSTRKFLEDGDTVTMRGRASKGDVIVGLGEVTSKILPAT